MSSSEIPPSILAELEPSVNNLIKKYLGFAEPTVLSSTLHSLQAGSSSDQLTSRLSTIVDRQRATKLSSKINDLVEDYYMTRGMSRPGESSRKRSHVTQPDEEHPDIKRAKSNGSESAARPSQDASALANAAPGTGAPMTADQIRAMMSNARKEIQARKNALSNLKGNKVEPVTPAAQPTPASLPPPGIAIPGMAGIQAPSTGLPSSQEKSKSIADLQAQIAARLKNVGIPSLVGAGRPGGPVVPAGPIAGHQPRSLMLNDEGRTVDATGQEVTLDVAGPTLKANMRRKETAGTGKDGGKDHLEKSSGLQSQSNSSSNETTASKHFDPRVAAKSAARTKRTGFVFNEPGKYIKEGARMRMKAQLERLQADISTIARKTGIQSATQLAKLVPKGDEKGSRCPDVEWWDNLILNPGRPNGNYEDALEHIREEAITNLIEHPIQMKPMESTAAVEVQVFLTKKEMKKMRRQKRREAWKEKQDKIRLGLVQPDEAKVKMSNLMRVLGNEAIQDPTKVEAHVRAQMAKRKETHEKMNEERKLTPEQRKEKNIRKIKEDTSGGVDVAVYRVKSFQNQSKKFKVETNARQLWMTGTIVLYEDVNVVVVEGGPKQQKKYKQLMLKRIKWTEETFKDKEGAEVNNQCVLVWEGQVKERCFGEMKFKQCPSETYAREHFQKAGVEHYWDQSYSGAVLEASSF